MSRPSYTQTATPALRPLSLGEVKDYVEAETTDDDKLLMSLIDAATVYVQEYQWSQLITATWVQRMDRFPCGPIELHPNPVSAVSSVQYVDTGGTTQSLTVTTDYTVDLYRRPGIVLPAYTKSWPTTRGYVNDVVVTFTAGYGTEPSNVPRNIREAMLLMIRQWYMTGGCEDAGIPMLARALLDVNSFRVFA